jgi:endonuclease/exonuclease/phosphatase family metal-dependent hydrolase
MRILKAVSLLITLLIIAAMAYAAYVFIDYHRLGDNITLEIDNMSSEVAQAGTAYTITTYNVGFGAYSADYSFFMDGGEYSRAYDEQTAIDNINGCAGIISEIDPDFAFFQEVDTYATRSYHVNEYGLLSEHFEDYSSVFAMNYDSPYLLYPPKEPIGKSQSGIVTFSKYGIGSAVRRSLPIEKGFRKLLDLDRCYSKCSVPLADGRKLILINLHLSAYTEDAAIGERQLQMVFKEAQREYEAGNCIIIGGDFNKDLLGNSPEIFDTPGEVPNWALPINTLLIPESFVQVRPESETDIYPTVRDCDTGYNKGVSFVSAIDGFIVSDNVEILHCEHMDTGFQYSDHNPVMLQFQIN